jgi:hypothetical protein
MSALENAQRPILYDGRTTVTAVEPTTESLYNLLLHYEVLKTKLVCLNQLIADLPKPERATEMRFLL